MNTVLHVVSTEGSPFLGGMEESVLRIGKYFVSFGDVVHLYTRLKPLHDDERAIYRDAGIDFVDLEAAIHTAMTPLPIWFDADKTERTRLYTLLLRDCIQRNVAKRPNQRHILVSFSISKNGYVCQHVANDLALPHIACIRGSDFSRDFLSANSIAGIEFVVRQADWIATTNSIQRERVAQLFGRSHRCRTILNPVAVPVHSLWRPHSRLRVRIFCDCGYSFRKGTHILVSVVEELLAEGVPVCLSIVGRVMSGGEEKYWEKFIAERRANPNLELRGYVPKEALTDLLLKSDIYCSATIGEGCSNASLSAAALGLPIVATNCGALGEMTAGLPNIVLVPPLDRSALKEELRTMSDRLRAGLVEPDHDRVRSLHQQFACQTESEIWQEIVADIHTTQVAKHPAENATNLGRRAIPEHTVQRDDVPV